MKLKPGAKFALILLVFAMIFGGVYFFMNKDVPIKVKDSEPMENIVHKAPEKPAPKIELPKVKPEPIPVEPTPTPPIIEQKPVKEMTGTADPVFNKF